ncbi:TPA: recombinase family protein [Klebsiella variicola]|nr:recombinase family protein [Klebsiella variicola]
MIIGYARVSSNHQDTELQMQALSAAGCKLIFEEKASGRKTNRPVLKKVIDMLEPGDELVIWKLDRIGRNVLHALLTFQSLSERKVNIRSITDGVDLSTASGRYNFRNILSAAQYESDLNSERTLAGLAVARSKGRFGGRRPKFTDEHWSAFEREIRAGRSHRDVAQQYGVGISTLYKKIPSVAGHREPSTSI